MSEKETEVEAERSGILQNKLPAPIHPLELESQTEKKVRYRSIRIGQVALLIFSIGFSIVLTGVYPYMTQVRHFCIIYTYYLYRGIKYKKKFHLGSEKPHCLPRSLK